MSSRPILLITLPSLGMGGAEQFLTSLANELSVRFEVHFYIFSSNLALESRLERATVHSNNSPFMGIFRLRKAVRMIKPDIILTSITDLNLIIIALRFLYPENTKVIVREAIDPEFFIRLSRFPKLTKFLYHYLYPRADHIICLSNNMRKEVHKLLSPLQPSINVISNGVGDQRMLSLPIQRPIANTILAVGRLSWQKGFDQLIRAFSEFARKKQGQGYRLIIVGEGEKNSELKNLINELNLEDRILLIGLVDDPTPFYALASFMVLPSRYEGVSNAMLEALVNGVPVLATSNRTSAEHYVDDGNGVLIGCCDEREILEGLERMDERLPFFDKNEIAETWRNRISLSIVADAYADLIQELMV